MAAKAPPSHATEENPEQSGFLVSGRAGPVWVTSATVGKRGKLPSGDEVVTVQWHEKRGSALTAPTRESVQRTVDTRARALAERRFIEVDQLSAALTAMGVSFEDREGGTKWWLKR